MAYNPLVTMSRQLAHYMFSSEPAPLGRGFDRWFVFLSQASIAHNTILALLRVQLTGLLFFSARLTQALRAPSFAAMATPTDPPPLEKPCNALKSSPSAARTKTRI